MAQAWGVTFHRSCAIQGGALTTEHAIHKLSLKLRQDGYGKVPVSVFISYSHKDERLRDELATHLAILQNQKVIAFWHDRKITAGSEWAKEIDENLRTADLILLLVSPDFLASNYCNDVELKLAMDRHQKGEAIVIPILLKPVSWKGAPFAKLQACPTNAKPVTKWTNRDEAFTDVLEAIRLAAQKVEAGLGRQRAGIQPDAVSALPGPVVQAPAPGLAERSPSFLPSEPPEGTVPLDSRFYVPWPSESRWLAEIEKPGALIRIKSPNNMGKSSLMARVLAHAKEVGQRSVELNLDELNLNILEDLNKFMQWFCASLGRKLGVQVRREDYWDETFGANDNSTEFVEQYLLKPSDQPIVVAIDNFHRIFEFPDIATDFCGLLRGWHERSRTNSQWAKLRLIVVYSQEPYFSQDINQSPFNVGLPIELDAFSAGQLQALIERYGLDLSPEQRQRLFDLLGGHPLLVRLGLDRLAREGGNFEDFLQQAPTEAGCFGEHLRHLRQLVEQQPALKEAFSGVIGASEPVRLRPEDAFKLDSLGLVVPVDNEVKPRCPLYCAYFQDCWGETGHGR